MKVEITLNDHEGQPVFLLINNCEKPELVGIEICCEAHNFVIVSIEDLKLALKKICAK